MNDEKTASAVQSLRLQYVGGCVTCQDTFRLAGEVIRASTEKLNDAYALIQELRAERDQALRDVERAAADENANARDLARARAELRDAERENASLRRRLAIGGR